MELNADFSAPAIVHSKTIPWVPSPMNGVDRRMLDRIGDEVARATTIVRYAAGSQFSAHTHSAGEEFLVLEGVFQDEHGDFPVGTYVRNPPTSSHTPGSEPGCVIFVKLRQFQPDDRQHVRIDTLALDLVPLEDGVRSGDLFSDEWEHVSIEVWEANRHIDLRADRSLELLVLAGEFSLDGETLVVGSWMRLPVGSDAQAEVGSDGARVWVKRNHLASV